MMKNDEIADESDEQVVNKKKVYRLAHDMSVVLMNEEPDHIFNSLMITMSTNMKTYINSQKYKKYLEDFFCPGILYILSKNNDNDEK